MHSIFLEGKGDDVFIEKYLNHISGNNWNNKVRLYSTGGWSKLHLVSNEMEKTNDAGFQNFLIFDADSPSNNGGFAVRQQELINKGQELNLQFSTFLFPNNSDDGDFETLLERIVNAQHSRLLECYSQYEICISQFKDGAKNNIYKLPVKKAKIYSYVDAFPKSRKQNEAFKNGNYFYENPDYWDLDSQELSSLKAYLESILS